MRLIGYSTSTRIWLSLEDYTNAGLTRARIVEAITRIKDPWSISLNLRVTNGPINENLIVECSAPAGVNAFAVDDLVHRIRVTLEGML